MTTPAPDPTPLTAPDPAAVGKVRPRGPRATLGSVATLAGVSRQTVSNVLNSPELVRSDTAQRVRAAIQELSYRPQLAAQQLRTRRSQLLGMRIHQAPEPTVFDRFLHAVTQAAAVHDYRVILYTAADDDQEIESFSELHDRWNVDGLVLSYTHSGDRRTSYLAQQEVPFVTFGRPWDRSNAHSWVDVDGCAGTRAATNHLIAAGHRRIGYLGWPEGSDVGDDRLSGWAAAMSAAGLPAPEPRRCVNDSDAGRVAAAELLHGGDLTAVVCVSDLVALGALAAAEHAGLRVGSELAVVGFDDSDKAAGADLTSLSQPLTLVAEHCVRLMLRQIMHPGGDLPPEQVLLAPTLIPRGSTGNPG